MTPRLHLPTLDMQTERAQLDRDASRYLTRVLRLGVGARVLLMDGRENARFGVIDSLGDKGSGDGVELRLMERVSTRPEPPLELTLVQGLLKGSNFELVIQKAAELGAARVIPLISERVIKRPDAKRVGNQLERWRRIATEAMEQCGRGRLMEITEPSDWKGLAALLDDGLRLIPWEESADGAAPTLGELARTLETAPQSVTLIIGPEGGFPAHEVARAQQELQAQPVRLGPRILRAETAAISAVTLALGVWGDLL
ncbi:RsmE family RNA methyltransferase [Magnetofaba australis]|uniref:Ribosomal RNA small subunit methyltransferase E n=1 Tax=Magnetofaba australis IT-1 TaxID=1434232 RepID=A0A1Y2K177_9PROT|nr:16S rRNA (uracil(1498)-N(3))-methyltransferase [Magnetofaba australis]OSM01376.1 putative 16S rRNA (uracil1498-N3)-methyltransferase [Magnetofaba australis IT-1]